MGKGVKNVTVVGVCDEHPGSMYVYTFKTREAGMAFIKKASAHDDDPVSRWEIINTTTDTPKNTYAIHRMWVAA